jgi:hypothetical protein
VLLVHSFLNFSPYLFLTLAVFFAMMMAVSSFPAFLQCLVVLVACFTVGLVSAASSSQDSNTMVFPLTSFTMNLTIGSQGLTFTNKVQSSLQNVVADQLNSFLEPSSGNITVLGATLVQAVPNSMVVLFAGETEFGLGIAPDSVNTIEMVAIQGNDGFNQLMQRIHSNPNLQAVESVDITFIPSPSSSLSPSPSSGVGRWFVPVITVISIFFFVALLVLTCIILIRVRARRLRRQEKQDLGSKATRESDSETSDNDDDLGDDDSTWYEDVTREIKGLNADAASWLDDWAKSIQSIQIREPAPQSRKKTTLATPRPAARQSSRLTLESIDEESTNMELPMRKDFKAPSSKKKTLFAPPQVFNPHALPLPKDPNVPALVMDHQPDDSRAYL